MSATNQFKLTVVPDTSELERQLAEQGRKDFIKRKLNPPNFPHEPVSNEAPGHLTKTVEQINAPKPAKKKWWGI